jgi:REP element-mobilizing transposase RayT
LRIRHGLDGAYVYFVTFTIVDWLPIFINLEPVEIIHESLRFCIKNKHLRIHAYVIMPNHIHLIEYDSNCDNDRPGKTRTEFRKFTGRKVADTIGNTLAESLSLAIRSKPLTNRIRQGWRRGWHAEGLASEGFLLQKMNYRPEKTVPKGFVKRPEQWLPSSTGFWINEEACEIRNFPFV